MFIVFETKKDLKEQLYEAERRAGEHFTKVMKIENILEKADITKENYFKTIDKIKRVIYSDQTIK